MPCLSWRGSREGVESRRENWAGARTAELVPPLASRWGHHEVRPLVSRLSGRSCLLGGLPSAPEGGQHCRRAKCPARLCQRPHWASPERKARVVQRWARPRARGPGSGSETGKGACVCLCARDCSHQASSGDMSLPAAMRSKKDQEER